MLSITLVWLILILAGIRKEEKECLFKANISAIRGISAIEIMMGHIGLATNSLVLYPNRKAGILFVGIFFVLSGYGLAYSLSVKQNYLKGFVISKITKILIPAYVVYVCGVVINSVINQSGEIITVFNPVIFFQKTNWYVWEIMLFYLIFYIAYRFLKESKADIVIGCVSVLFILVCFVLKVSNPWYGSTICFWLGIVYYRNEQELKQVFRSRPFLFWVGAVVLAVSILIFFVDQKGFIGLVCARNIAAAVFSVLVLLLLYKYHIGNAVTNWLGNISYEIFLIHFVVIGILKDKFSSSLVYAWLVIVVTVCAAMILKKIEGLFRRKRYIAKSRL